jgi:hypothetical protein
MLADHLRVERRKLSVPVDDRGLAHHGLSL